MLAVKQAVKEANDTWRRFKLTTARLCNNKKVRFMCPEATFAMPPSKRAKPCSEDDSDDVCDPFALGSGPKFVVQVVPSIHLPIFQDEEEDDLDEAHFRDDGISTDTETDTDTETETTNTTETDTEPTGTTVTTETETDTGPDGKEDGTETCKDLIIEIGDTDDDEDEFEDESSSDDSSWLSTSEESEGEEQDPRVRKSCSYSGATSAPTPRTFFTDEAVVTIVGVMSTFSDKATRRHARDWLQNTQCCKCRKGICTNAHIDETPKIIRQRNLAWRRGHDELRAAAEGVAAAETALCAAQTKLQVLEATTRADICTLMCLGGDGTRDDMLKWVVQKHKVHALVGQKADRIVRELVDDDSDLLALTNLLSCFCETRGKLVGEDADIDVVKRNRLWEKTYKQLLAASRQVRNAQEAFDHAREKNRDVFQRWRCKLRSLETRGYFASKVPEASELVEVEFEFGRGRGRGRGHGRGCDAVFIDDGLERDADLMRLILKAQQEKRMQTPTPAVASLVKAIAAHCGV